MPSSPWPARTDARGAPWPSPKSIYHLHKKEKLPCLLFYRLLYPYRISPTPANDNVRYGEIPATAITAVTWRAHSYQNGAVITFDQSTGTGLYTDRTTTVALGTGTGMQVFGSTGEPGGARLIAGGSPADERGRHPSPERQGRLDSHGDRPAPGPAFRHWRRGPWQGLPLTSCPFFRIRPGSLGVCRWKTGKWTPVHRFLVKTVLEGAPFILVLARLDPAGSGSL